MKKFDYLIVGAGLYGATFAYEASKKGKKCLVIDRRNHIGGNIYCEKINDINFIVTDADLKDNALVLQKGKKVFLKVNFIDN